MTQASLTIQGVSETSAAAPSRITRNAAESASIAFLFTAFGLVILTWVAAIGLAVVSR